MNEKTIVDFAILAITFGSAFILIGYEEEAINKGWPVGMWLSGDASWLKVLAFLAMIGTLGLSFYIYFWWSPVIVFGLGFLFGFIATQLLKQNVQFIAVLGTVVGWVICLIYVL